MTSLCLRVFLRVILTLFFLSSLSISVLAVSSQRIQGFAEQGGFSFSGGSTAKVQRSFPNCTITVYLAGTTTLASIYSNSTLSIPKSNPFLADSVGYYYFYGAGNLSFDVKFSGTEIATPFTLADIKGVSTGSSFYCDESLGCINPNTSPYNCVVDSTSDSSICMQAALDAAKIWSVANGGKPAGVYFDDGLYTLTADLNTANGCRSQVCFPTSVYTNPGSVLVTSKSQRIYGPGAFNSNPNAGLFVKSTLTGKSYTVAGLPAVFGGKAIPSPLIADQNWVQYHFNKVAVITPANPSVTAIDARSLNRFILEDSRVTTVPESYTIPADYATATNPTGLGVLMPLNNADAGMYRGWIEIHGYYGCMGISETTTLSGHAQIVNCKVGEVVQAPFYHIPNIAGSIYDVRSEYGLAFVDFTSGVTNFPAGTASSYLNTIKLNFISFEDSDDVSRGPIRLSHIYDPTNNLRVVGDYGLVATNVGNRGTQLLKTGGRNSDWNVFRNIYNPDYGPQYTISDLFNAADSTLVTTRKPDINKSGNAWTALNNNFTITNNHVIPSTNVADNDVVIDSGISNGTIIARTYFQTNSTSQAIGIQWRVTDINNRYFCEWTISNGDFKIYKIQGGVPTTVGNFPSAISTNLFPNQLTEEHTIRVNMTGDSMQVMFDYAVLAIISDSFNNTATKHGLHSFGNQGVIERFDIYR